MPEAPQPQPLTPEAITNAMNPQEQDLDAHRNELLQRKKESLTNTLEEIRNRFVLQAEDAETDDLDKMFEGALSVCRVIHQSDQLFLQVFNDDDQYRKFIDPTQPFDINLHRRIIGAFRQHIASQRPTGAAPITDELNASEGGPAHHLYGRIPAGEDQMIAIILNGGLPIDEDRQEDLDAQDPRQMLIHIAVDTYRFRQVIAVAEKRGVDFTYIAETVPYPPPHSPEMSETRRQLNEALALAKEINDSEPDTSIKYRQYREFFSLYNAIGKAHFARMAGYINATRPIIKKAKSRVGLVQKEDFTTQGVGKFVELNIGEQAVDFDQMRQEYLREIDGMIELLNRSDLTTTEAIYIRDKILELTNKIDPKRYNQMRNSAETLNGLGSQLSVVHQRLYEITTARLTLERQSATLPSYALLQAEGRTDVEAPTPAERIGVLARAIRVLQNTEDPETHADTVAELHAEWDEIEVDILERHLRGEEIDDAELAAITADGLVLLQDYQDLGADYRCLQIDEEDFPWGTDATMIEMRKMQLSNLDGNLTLWYQYGASGDVVQRFRSEFNRYRTILAGQNFDETTYDEMQNWLANLRRQLVIAHQRQHIRELLIESL